LIPKDSAIGRAVGLRQDKFVSYRRMDPFSSLLGIVADFADVWAYMTEEERERSSVTTTAAIVTLTRNLLNKTYLEGLSNLFQVFEQIAGEKDFGIMERHAARQLATLRGAIPGAAWFARAFEDDVRRDPGSAEAAKLQSYRAAGYDVTLYDNLLSLADQIASRAWARTQSEKAPPLLNLWGEEVPHAHGPLFDMIPFYSRDAKIDTAALDAMGLDRLRWTGTRVRDWDQGKWLRFLRAAGANGEFIRLGWSPSEHPRAVKGVQLTPQERHDYVKAVNETEPDGAVSFVVVGAPFVFSYGGMRLREATLELMRSEEYRSAPDLQGSRDAADGTHSKREMIQRLFDVYRHRAGLRDPDLTLAGADLTFAERNPAWVSRFMAVRAAQQTRATTR